jgi:stearoyl-CoA desaturase (delta-9 desaturase)
VINGVGHYWGYRNFAPNDAAKNILPWGILIGGEELHNNHHAYAASAKLSSKWWELDIGWMYIRTLEMLRLAKVRRVAPKIRINASKTRCDTDTVQAVITHRYEVLAAFAKSLKKTAVAEIRTLRRALTIPGTNDARVQDAVKRWLQSDGGGLPDKERAVLEQALNCSKVLRTIFSMQQELPPCGAGPPPRRSNWSNSWKPGADAPRTAASAHCKCSLGSCAAMTDF